ncbi:phage head-tail connector protein [Clostridium lacusfryxellense]|uniref:phage head-tail connector protein n=1 Tax=Clostridium lacusfryxellense TaxID=205328 RepID=UPI001C0E87C5|nr:phage head-tail connector protein [Clostridium lacusfryxellense]MBU3112123.1 phage head-tail connector protein [Clostridium lacusfryxellense]
MVILDDLNIMLGKNSESDDVLNILIRRTKTAIKHYLNSETYTDTNIEENFQDAIIVGVLSAFNIKGKERISNERFGTTSVSYRAISITDEMKDLLPCPSCNLLG